MKVKVTGPYQIVHDGKTYVEGDTVDAPESDARLWVSRGYAEEAKAEKKAEKAEAKESKDSAKSESKDSGSTSESKDSGKSK